MTPQESITQSLVSNEQRLLVINQQIAVLLEERRRQEEIGHRLVDALIGYETRSQR